MKQLLSKRGIQDSSVLEFRFQTKFFNQKISQTKRRKIFRYFLYLIIFVSFLIILGVIAAINIRYANGGKYNFKDLFYIFATNNVFDNNLDQIRLIPISEGNGLTFDSFQIRIVPIKQAIWISIASVLAGIGLAIAGSISQGLTKNPLADPTTLGATESSVFGAVLMNVFLASVLNASYYQYIFFAFIFLGGSVSVFFLLLLIKNSSQNLSYLKITLAGLVVSIFFKTLSFLLRSVNSTAQATSFSMAIGGAENIYGLYSSQQTILFLGMGIILASIVISFFVSRDLTLLELGDDKATTLGVNTKRVKFIGLMLILFTVPISIALVGNVAFVGLFAPHMIRIFLRTRDYRIVIPLSALLGAIALSLGTTLNTFFNSIPSSVYMIFIGAPMLVYLGWTKKGGKNIEN